MRKLNLKLKKKGQTALEYALVVGAISLVLMAAWNVVGDNTIKLIKDTIGGRISEQITKGNATVKR